jgi:hypothetical protein
MKEHPILFSGPMVRAILEGRKTQTRRIIKPQPDGWIRGNSGAFGVPKKITNKKPHKNGTIWQEEDDTCYEDINCPYGQPDDRLWVRETWQLDEDERGFVYRADIRNFADYAFGPPSWRPSIFMPRKACRIVLEIADIRVERLQEISEADAIGEGVEWWHEERLKSRPKHYRVYCDYDNPKDPAQYTSSAVDSFSTLWQSINGPESWNQNPWVWVIEFNRIEQ